MGNKRLIKVAAGRTREKGLVLVMVLWIVIVLTIIVTALGRNSRLDARIGLMELEQARCKWACRAGIEKAVAILNEDTRDSDYLMELWSYSDADFNNITLEGCLCNVRVIDECGKLNINTVTKEQLMMLPYMEEYIADAIIDWRDSDDTPSGLGVEAGYYENLPFRYPIRNGPLKTIRELLLVKDITEELFYGEDTNFNGQLDYNERDGDENPPPDDGDDELDLGWISFLTCYSYSNNLDADGNSKININQATAAQMEESLGISSTAAQAIVKQRGSNQFTSIVDLIDSNSPGSTPSLDTQTFYDIADKITVNSQQQTQGKVNVNTAPKEVLTVLLGGDGNAMQIAENIVASRAGSLEGMKSTTDLMQLGLVDTATFRKIENSITTRSDVFTIRCWATATRGTDTGVTLQTEEVVDRSTSPHKILYWYQGAGN